MKNIDLISHLKVYFMTGVLFIESGFDIGPNKNFYHVNY